MTGQSPVDLSTREQIVALQTLYSQQANHDIPDGDPRAERLRWASEIVGREISSFSRLSRDEARILIDLLKGLNGQAPADRPRPWRRVRSRERAHAAGSAGRRRNQAAFIQMAGPDDFARIDQALDRLGWSSDRYAAWLRSPASPLKGAGPEMIRTVGQVNRVWWALKAMLKRSGRWCPKPASGNTDVIAKLEQAHFSNRGHASANGHAIAAAASFSACLSSRGTSAFLGGDYARS